MARLARLPGGQERRELSKRLTGLLSSRVETGLGLALIHCLSQRERANVLMAWAKMLHWPQPEFMQVGRTSGALFKTASTPKTFTKTRMRDPGWPPMPRAPPLNPVQAPSTTPEPCAPPLNPVHHP